MDNLKDKAPRRRRRRSRGINMDEHQLLALHPDRYRHIVFPNAIRRQRVHRGSLSLLRFSALLPSIPYIRLSKLERGEVLPRVEEIVEIAAAIEVKPLELFEDLEAKSFDVAAWALEANVNEATADDDDLEDALLLAAAMRYRRDNDRSLTAMYVQERYGIAPVLLSRLENATKPFSAWSEAVITQVCEVMGASSLMDLRSYLRKSFANGTFNAYLAQIPGRDDRIKRARLHYLGLRAELTGRSEPANAISAHRADHHVIAGGERLVPVLGVLMINDRIALHPTGSFTVLPPGAGPNAYALKTSGRTHWFGLPRQTCLILDPDRQPSDGDLVFIHNDQGYQIGSIRQPKCDDRLLIDTSNGPPIEVTTEAIIGTAIAAFF